MKFKNALLLVFLVLLLGCKQKGITVERLEIQKGSPTIFRFNLSHNFPQTQDCYSNISLFKQDAMVSNEVSYLGEFSPDEVKEQIVTIDFPGNKTDYQIDINCFPQNI